MVASAGGLANGGGVVELKIYEACCIVQWTRNCRAFGMRVCIRAVEHGIRHLEPSYTF